MVIKTGKFNAEKILSSKQLLNHNKILLIFNHKNKIKILGGCKL